MPIVPKVKCLCNSMYLPDLLKCPGNRVAWKCPECDIVGPHASDQDAAAIAWDNKFKNALGKDTPE